MARHLSLLRELKLSSHLPFHCPRDGDFSSLACSLFDLCSLHVVFFPFRATGPSVVSAGRAVARATSIFVFSSVGAVGVSLPLGSCGGRQGEPQRVPRAATALQKNNAGHNVAQGRTGGQAGAKWGI